MKINIYNSPDIKFKELQIGECCMCNGNLYMRIHKCRHVTEDWKTYNAISLSDGEFTDFCEESLVRSVNAQVVIE